MENNVNERKMTAVVALALSAKRPFGDPEIRELEKSKNIKHETK